MRAPAATPTFISAAPAGFYLRVDAPSGGNGTLCDRFGVRQFCVEHLADVLADGLRVALAEHLRPVAGSVEYVAELSPLTLRIHRNAWNDRVLPVLEWRFVLRASTGESVVVIQDVTGMPREVPFDETAVALRTLENQILERVRGTLAQFKPPAPTSAPASL